MKERLKIHELFKKDYEGYTIEYVYRTKSYYEVKVKDRRHFAFVLKKKNRWRKVEKKSESKLFEANIKNPKVFAIIDNKKIVAVIEGSKEEWNQTYRIWNLNVEKRYRRQSYGKTLMDHIIKVAKKEKCRAIVLEVQSCNMPAIEFYFKQGFRFIGLNTISYSNQDIKKKEVRLEMGLIIK
jgi:ribosomal protein S18 acetylase RimI-like enzyme